MKIFIFSKIKKKSFEIIKSSDLEKLTCKRCCLLFKTRFIVDRSYRSFENRDALWYYIEIEQRKASWARKRSISSGKRFVPLEIPE